MIEPDAQKLILGAMALGVMQEVNGGRPLGTIWHYKRAAKRLGLRVHWLPRDADVDACRRDGQQVGMQGVIYIRRTHNIPRLRRQFLHELAEAATRYEGVPPFACQVTRHQIACEVERLSFRF